MQAVSAIIEDDAGRVLVVQNPDGVPTLPRLEIHNTQGPLKELRRFVNQELGLEISGWADILCLTEGKHKYTFFRAYVSGGKAKTFPTSTYLSLSFLAPDLAVKVLEGEATTRALKARYPRLY